MSSEIKFIPRTNASRNTFLTAAINKHIALGVASILTPTTATKLVAQQPAYKLAMAAIGPLKAVYYNSAHDKEAKGVACAMWSSHFIQTFFMGVQRGVFAVGDLAYYGLDENGTLPDMSSEEKILEVAQKIVDGDINRMAVAGAVAMSMPTAAEVKAKKVAFETARTATNNALDALKQAQIACNALNGAADELIRFLQGEIETHFSNLPRATMRDEARLWGMKYTKGGSDKKVTGVVTDAANGLAIEGAVVRFANGLNEDETTVAGAYAINTTLMDVQDLIAEHPLYKTYTEPQTLVEGTNPVINIKMVRL